MAKHGRHRRPGGRTTPKGTRPVGYGRTVGHDEPEIIRQARAAIRSGPVDLLLFASELVEACADRPADRVIATAREVPDLTTLLADFARAEFAPARTLAAAMLPLVRDELLVARVRRTLEHAPAASNPDWMATLDVPTVERVVTTIEPFGDGDNIVISIRWPSGHAATACVYIDHNLGRVAKDAFVVPIDADDYEELFRKLGGDGLRVTEIDAATARARIETAIRLGEMTVPQYTSESWPMCRPFVEWVTALLPPGGATEEPREWTDTERRAIRERFMASSFATELTIPDSRLRDLCDELLWFGTSWSGGDPLRWSPVRVELVLADWFPRKVQLPRSEVADFPDLLRAFIRFAHAERAMAPDLTDETLDTVTAWEPEFFEAIKHPAPTPAQSAARLARLAAGLDPDDDDDFLAYDPGEYLDIWENGLLAEIGGRSGREALTDAPIDDEPFDWTGIPDDERDLVAAALRDVDRLSDALLDVEMRTLCRRYLAATVLEDRKLFQRSQRTDLIAGGIVWAAVHVQTRIAWPGNVTGVPTPKLKDITALLGVAGSVSQRASSIEWKLRKLSRERHWWHSAFQREVLDQFAAIAEHRAAERDR